jgi:hypothetical protein
MMRESAAYGIYPDSVAINKVLQTSTRLSFPWDTSVRRSGDELHCKRRAERRASTRLALKIFTSDGKPAPYSDPLKSAAPDS